MLWTMMGLLLLLFIIQIALIVIIEHRRPHKVIAWTIIQFLFPLIGILLYFFIAKNYSSRPQSTSTSLERIKTDLLVYCRKRAGEESLYESTRHQKRLLALLQNIPSAPITVRNETIVYPDGAHAFEAMLEAMSAAKDHIHIEFYIVRDDHIGTRFQQLMIRKAKEGVKVRLLYDGIGSHQLDEKYLKQLHDAGIETGCFSPPWSAFIDKRLNYRNHRKILVIDGKICFFGGLNIGDEYLGKDSNLGFWRDTHLSVKGDAVLWLQYTFATDWFFVKGAALTGTNYFPMFDTPGKEVVQIIKSGPDGHRVTLLEVFFSCIASARERIYIETPYFIPDPSILMALKTAAASGIDVRIIIPENSDSKFVQWATLSFVQELLEAGVHIFQYGKGFIHAKVMIADNLACCGTANMDMRSFYDQFEVHAVFFDPKTVERFEEDFLRDLQASSEILLAEFRKRREIQKIKESVARALSSLF
ncbi:cardiolipin synthase [Paenibacillus ehimensis]|uniref:cardiolipin synthase n=1 Tax=Paenibacillus ehimensis TaxID=79264 RepID=UPI000472AE36|nr:cardiolipin synthase [Paenibacillus ehimensis]